MVPYNVLKGLYALEKTIGCGGFAKVKLATHIATGEKVAIKIMDKSTLKGDIHRVELELKALKTLSHPHVCKLYQVIETDTHFFIVIEYCSGGELFDHIVEKNRLSESESRVFFRQIVSAVAYLHSLGYAHRDIKPENILLDRNETLKLIDFGLCAKPHGGMQNPLFTSCGSPTYAAPELVLGHPYLGQEVDVWAMGVLLYALLAGYLPFDDQNIDSLYKKILNGKYEEPAFMSQGSRRLIRQMLQVNPKKRITIKELLSHPWLTISVFEPVQIQTENMRQRDDDCLLVMSKYCGVPVEYLWDNLKMWHYNYETATYLLLQLRKKKRLPLRLATPLLKTMFTFDKCDEKKMFDAENNSKCNDNKRENYNFENALKPLNVGKLEIKYSSEHQNYVNSPGCKKRETENSPTLSSPNHFFMEPSNKTIGRKPAKRIRSPTLETDDSPVPTKKPTSGKSTPKTPEWKKPANYDTPASTRKVFGSIERSFQRVRHVLTPRKVSKNYDSSPIVLTCKDLCNVSTTQCNNPNFVITELSKALEKKGIECERRGYSIRGKVEPIPNQRIGGCSFELEICYLPKLTTGKVSSTPTKSILKNGVNNLQNPSTPIGHKTTLKFQNENCAIDEVIDTNLISYFVGIRRKRLKGDSWCYKKVCEEVLALTATDFKQQPTESTV